MIKEIMDKLSEEDKKQLMIAFEGEFTQIVELGDSKFIGVNVVDSETHNILEQTGVWSYGELKCHT